jgi:deoxyhypusine synthase
VDQLIAAFKVNGKTVEICRTSHNKSHEDLIKCTKIPANAEICFLDDTFYPEMANDNIYYINVKPYYYDLQFDYMIQKFTESELGKKITQYDNDFEKKMMELIKRYKYDCIDKDSDEYEMDKIVGKQIITHLQQFFSKSKRTKTQKNRPKRSSKKKTFRKY